MIVTLSKNETAILDLIPNQTETTEAIALLLEYALMVDEFSIIQYKDKCTSKADEEEEDEEDDEEGKKPKTGKVQVKPEAITKAEQQVRDAVNVLEYRSLYV